jgi:uncharacterized phage protein (TIGR01671 family)
MNREIKFRIWDEEVNKMMTWDDIKQKGMYASMMIAWPNLMQYIALKDKNGKEIYEGDIVNFTKRGMTHGPEAENVKNAEVWYSSEDCAFAFGKYKSADYTWWYSMVDVLCDFEVVGNIFENKDLLK